MITMETADEGAALLSTAIGELVEDASAEAVMMSQGDHTVWVMRADKLEAVGLDVAALARAMRVLATWRDDHV